MCPKGRVPCLSDGSCRTRVASLTCLDVSRPGLRNFLLLPWNKKKTVRSRFNTSRLGPENSLITLKRVCVCVNSQHIGNLANIYF